MKRILLVVGLLCLSGTAQAQFRASELREMCAIPAGKNTCSMWISGFLTGMFAVQAQTPKENRVTCIPNGVDGNQAQLIIEKFSNENPNLLHHPAGPFAYAAITRAFPCN
jgi:hypothetical protein